MRQLVPGSLLGQLALLIVITFLSAQAVSFGLFTRERSQAIRAAQELEVADRTATVARLVEQAPAGMHGMILQAANSPQVQFSVDTLPAVTTTAASPNAIIRRIYHNLGEDRPRDIGIALEPYFPHGAPPFELPAQVTWFRERMIDAGVAPTTVRLSVPLAAGGWLNMTAHFQRLDVREPPILILTTLLSIAGVVAALSFGLRRITGPLRRLVVAADGIGRGEDMPMLPASGPREVRALSEAFAQMQARLTHLIADRTRMLAALGHDLRSPITALRLRAEMVDDDETRERMSATLDEMQEMVEATLAYARGVTTDEPTRPVDLGLLLSELVAEVSEAGAAVRLEPAPSVTSRLRRTLIRRALRNILENAQRYGGGATVRLSINEPVVRIIVSDNGPGIAPNAIERVFDPFVRLESSRSRETGGTGLGLSIARSILRAHGGDVILANRPEGGLDAVIVLPVAETSMRSQSNAQSRVPDQI